MLREAWEGSRKADESVVSYVIAVQGHDRHSAGELVEGTEHTEALV